MARKVIEARGIESWRDVARLFKDWLQANEPNLNSFGFAEGDPIEHQGRRFLGFYIPAHHGEKKIALFDAWAKTTDRIFGTEVGTHLIFSDASRLLLPPRPEYPVPKWLEE